MPWLYLWIIIKPSFLSPLYMFDVNSNNIWLFYLDPFILRSKRRFLAGFFSFSRYSTWENISFLIHVNFKDELTMKDINAMFSAYLMLLNCNCHECWVLNDNFLEHLEGSCRFFQACLYHVHSTVSFAFISWCDLPIRLQEEIHVFKTRWGWAFFFTWGSTE